MMRARAFWTTGIDVGELRDEALAPPGEGEVLVEALYSGISRGTEALVFGGRVPPSEHARMRAPHQAGDFPFPVKYGYLSVGRVVAGVAPGREVFCLHPHQTRYVVPASAAFPLPAGVPATRAILAGNLETALNGLWDADVRAGDRVTVVGAGVVGCLVAYLAGRIPGCDVELLDLLPERRAVATALGVRFAEPAAGRRDADVVVHASGSAAGLTTALAVAGTEATVVEMSWYGNAAVTVPLGEAFHSRRLTIRSSQVGAVPSAQRARWSPARRLTLALSLLVDPALDVLIDGESPFESLPTVMPKLRGGLCHRVRYDG